MPEDLDLLQGSWTVTALEMDGQETPASILGDACIFIKGERFTSTGMGAVYEGTFKLVTSVKPCHIDMKFDKGPEKGNTNLGIYTLDGDSWTLCLATRGSVRPSEFVSSPGSGFAVETLTRGDAPSSAKPKASTSRKKSTGPVTELEGEWKMVSGVFDGKPMDEPLVKWVKRVTRGNETAVYAGPNVMMKAEFTLDSSTSPKAIDYVNTAGSNTGKTQEGIYEFEGHVLKIFMAAPGAPRPIRFETAPGKGTTLTVWKRG